MVFALALVEIYEDSWKGSIQIEECEPKLESACYIQEITSYLL